MNLGNEQKITGINNSVVSQAKGDVINNYGISAETAMEICKYVVKAELAVYTQNAREEAYRRLSDISEKTIERITALKEDLLHRFNEPAIQMALNETFKNYIISGDEELGENLIDLLIERLNVKERTTDQALIDEARNIVPKLSPSTVALLAMLVFYRIIFNANKKLYDEWIMQIAPMLERLENINSLDIAYLKQIGCGTGISSISTIGTLEQALLSNYDLLFRHKVAIDDVDSVLNKHSHALTMSNNFQYIRELLYREGDSAYFNVSSSSGVIQVLKDAGKDSLIPIFEELKSLASPFTEEEVRNYHIQKDSRWQFAFELFRKKELSTFQFNPVGVYIGIRQLSKINNHKIPMSLFYD